MSDESRLAELERKMTRLEERIEQVVVLAVQMTQLRAEFTQAREDNSKRFDKIDEDGKATRRTLIGFAFTVAVACIVALLASQGGPP